MNDLINRQDAIDGLLDLPLDYGRYDCASVEDMLMQLPQAQLEIIYCKDCKRFVRDDIEEQTPYGFYNTCFNAFCDKHFDIEQGEYIDVKLDDFCSFAERKNE